MTPHKLNFEKDGHGFKAKTPFGNYVVYTRCGQCDPRWYFRFSVNVSERPRPHETAEAAIRACRVDYVTRFNEAFGFDRRHDAAAVLARTLHYIETLPPGQSVGDINWPSVAAELRDIVCQMETETAA